MNFKKRKIFFSVLGTVGLLTSVSLTVTACSSTLDKYIKKSISKGNGNSFYDNGTGDLTSVVKRALLSTDGRTEALSALANRVSLKIIETIAKDKEGYQFKGDLELQKKKIDNEYNDVVKKYKKEHGSNAWALKFQQEILDPVGGTEESYKDDKLLSWANSYIVEKAFSTIYLTLIKDGKKFTPSSKTDLDKILSTTDKITYEFSEKYITSRATNIIDKVMAKLQQIIFEGWYKIENPFVVSTATWKYGNPKNGISSIYAPAKDSTTSKDEQGNETSTPNAASYEFPYFGNENETNTMEGEVTRFSKFLEASKTNNNFSQDGNTQNQYGLKKIDNKYNNSEEASTYKLVKSSSIFKDISLNQAAAISYLYGRVNQEITKVNDHDETMKKSLKGLNNSSNYLGFDKITGEFISDTRTSYGSSPNQTYFKKEIKLDKKLVSKIVNSKGPLKDNATKDLFVIDGLIPSNSELNEYMFVRDDKGVTVVGIDGDDYLKKAKGSKNTVDQEYDLMLKKSVDIVMYRYFENQLDKTVGFAFDVNKELSTFLTNNFSLVMLSFADSQKTDSIFGEQIFDINQNNVDLVKKLIDFNYAKSKYKNYNDFNKALYDNKKKYMGNYGDYNVADNGLASPYPMSSYSMTANVNSGYDFEFARLSSNLLDSNASEKAIKDRYENLSKQIDTYLKSKELSPLKSNFEGFKYSQYIYTNDLFINKILKIYTTTTKESDFIKINALAKDIGQKFDVSKLESKFESDTDLNTGIEWGLSNYFYGIEFNKTDSNRWQYYTLLTSNANGQNDFNVDKLNEYRKKLWNYEITAINYDGYDKYLNLYTTLATINYLIKDNYKEFLNYLSQTIYLGQTAYLVWANSYNSSLEDTTTTNSVVMKKSIKDILDVTKLNQNVNNSYQDNYFGTTVDLGDKLITNNVWSGSTFNDNNNYYNVAGNMLGFYGIQTSTSNGLPTTISNELFTKPKNNNANGNGILYGYENKENLIKHVKELTSITNIDSFAKKLAQETKTFDANSVLNQAITLDEKKKMFELNINNTSQIKNEYFQARNNYVGSLDTTTNGQAASYSTIVDPENSLLRHGAYAIQLNPSNIKTFNTLQTQIKTGLTASMNNGSTRTTDNTVDKNAKNIIGNLIVKAATDTNIQKNAINKIAANNKLNVYDINIYKQLGSAWIKNWKDIN